MADTLRGMSTASFWADDVKAAREWYTNVLGVKPYFERPDSNDPAYIEYRIGDYQHELGIIDRKFQPPQAKPGPGGTVLYWHVDDVQSMHEQLLAMGAKEYEPITEREAGFVTAAVTDPFGNILGLMYSPHYLEVLQGK
jgi:predicted enzyme related to lactoylglutathione lyase